IFHQRKSHSWVPKPKTLSHGDRLGLQKSRKLYETGVRYFKGKGNSLVYHFGSKSTKRIRKNKGRKTFLLKWGISSRIFTQLYLRMGQPFTDNLTSPDMGTLNLLKNKIKRIRSAW
ncbi:MAG: hypothetical protein NTW16_04775, partial [Bacteroidetes bacterium]|nr:hypothetical protein [Bacteroidota bacterium]